MPWDGSDWNQLPLAASKVLADPAATEHISKGLERGSSLIVVGRGFDYCIALEAALKLKETAGLLAQGYSAADLRHGPIAAVERALPILSFVSRGPAEPDMLDLNRELRRRGARVIEVGDGAAADIPVPEGLAEAIKPILLAIRAQQLAHALALRWGMDPDTPPRLQKVTPTT